MADHRHRWRSTAGLLVAGLLVLVSGCSSVPSSGPVVEGREVQVRQQEAFIRLLAVPPQAGADPLALVRGFLAAEPDADRDHAVARDYLAPDAQTGWRPNQIVRIYDDADVRIAEMPGPAVTFSAALLGSIESDGRYRPAAPGQRVETTFELQQVAGEWRISSLEPGLLLKPADIARGYRAITLYFLDPTDQRLVPDPVLVPVGQGLETAAVRALLRGPTSAMRGTATTAFPPGTDLAERSVLVENGIVDVALTPDAAESTDTRRRQMSAQLVWTLRALPDARAVRMTVQGEQFPVVGVPDPQSRDAWGEYNPDVLSTQPVLYAVRDGRLVRMVEAIPTVLAGPLGAAAAPLIAGSLSPDATRAAALGPDRSALRIATDQDGQAATEPIPGTDLTDPSWDVFGNVWVADRTPQGSQIKVLRPATAPRDVAIPDLTGLRIRALEVARDGTRLAVIVERNGRGELHVARIDHGADATQLGELMPVTPALDVVDVAWQGGDRLAVLAADPGGVPRPTVVRVDGWRLDIEIAPPLTPDPLVSVAAAPDDRLVVGTAGGQLLSYEGGSWTDAGIGMSPSFAR